MPKSEEKRKTVVNAVLPSDMEYIRIMDWQGKSLPFILADEISMEEGPNLMENKAEKLPAPG